jgi:tetratricopeptide (TPR) repeat protein
MSALTQRSLAYQEAKNYDAAVADLSTLIAKYPAAKEREAAMQQKALLLGQQDNGKAMTETFQQLLKEYPKTPVAAQAHYYIGKAAFEAKDYKAALPALDTSRKLNKEQYYAPATVRIISAHFYQKNRAPLVAEVNSFLASGSDVKVPGEILHWLGIEFYNEKNYLVAEKYLGALAAGEVANVTADFWFYLADAQTKNGNFAGAEVSYERYLQLSDDPAAKVKTLLALGATKIAAHKPDDAQKIAEEIMRLQPEGKVNAEARLLAVKCSSSAASSTKPGGPSWVWHCSTTTRRSRRAPCRRRPKRTRRPARPPKPIAPRSSCGAGIQSSPGADL